MAKNEAIIEALNRKMMKLLTRLPGAPKPVAYESRDGFAESPFVEEIAKVKIPTKLNIQPFPKLYNGNTDPQDHVAQYKQKMWQLSIPWELIEPTMCKSFGATLSGPALQWLINLKFGSINSFSSLVNKFYQ